MNKEKLFDAVEAACGHLPEGWMISLTMENGCGMVEMTNPGGLIYELESADMELYEEIEACIDIAIGEETDV